MPTRDQVDTVIIGAGPYALGLASRLAALGIERRVFGAPMRFWRDMPPGMFLKSFGFATSIPAAGGGHTLPEYCAAHGLETFEPIAMETFAAYGLDFQRRLVPDVEPVKVLSVRALDAGFDVRLETGARVIASRVVIATGLSHYDVMPAFARALPSGAASHTAHHQDFTRFAGQDVTVVGAGQSALQAAALLHEAGATTRLLAREPVVWHTRTPEHRPLLDRVREPMSVVGAGRKNWLLERVPALLHHLPDARRIRFTRGHLGPAGAWWLRDRVVGQVPIEAGTEVTTAAVAGSRIRLTLRGPAGALRDLLTDHVVAGTGFDVDVDRLPFLSADLVARIARLERAPRLSRHFESSIRGLYFVGPAAAYSFGPLARFIAGAPFATASVARHLARTRQRAARTVLQSPAQEPEAPVSIGA